MISTLYEKGSTIIFLKSAAFTNNFLRKRIIFKWILYNEKYIKPLVFTQLGLSNVLAKGKCLTSFYH